MGRRYLSLDFLRGVSIFGMIFSAIIPYGVLPAWMYHIQNPPPTHALDISVPGIGWVDLVFPIFIFCMGVAIPFSGRSAVAGTRSYLKSVVERFIMLWVFSYLYVLMNFSNVEGLWPQLFTIAGFGAIFMLYYRLSGRVKEGGELRQKRVWNVVRRFAAILLIVIIIAVGHYCFDEVIALHRRGIIIFLLAFLYLFGSLIWYFTRERIGLRCLIFALLFIFTHVTRLLDWPSITYANPNIRWWFNMEYFYFLLILIPATVVGDLLSKGINGSGELVAESENERGCNRGGRVVEHILFPLILLFVVWQCYALYMNITTFNLALSVPVALLFIWVAHRYLTRYRTLFIMAGVLVVWGLLVSVIEDGVKKVPCTISYCFTTCGISIYLLALSDYICKYARNSWIVGLFSGAGQNPLMSYIAYDLFVVPFMNATGIIHLYRSLYSAPDGEPLVGVLRAAVAVLFTMWLVSRFSRRGIFWRA